MGAWSFVEPNLEWVLRAHRGRAVRAAALRRAPGVGVDGDGAIVAALEHKSLEQKALVRTAEDALGGS